jgi:hypothetical protein
MKPQKVFGLGALTIVIGLSLSCKDSSGPVATKPPEEVLYQNSFEANADTVGLYGFGPKSFSGDVPAGGGRRSLCVTGGCTVPHVCCDLLLVDAESRLKLSCWGKMQSRGGRIELSLCTSSSPVLSITIKDTVWTQYQSAETIVCPKNERLHLSMCTDTTANSSMLVDVVTIVRIN